MELFWPLNRRQIVWWLQEPSRKECRRTCSSWFGCPSTGRPHRSLPASRRLVRTATHWPLKTEDGVEDRRQLITSSAHYVEHLWRSLLKAGLVTFRHRTGTDRWRVLHITQGKGSSSALYKPVQAQVNATASHLWYLGGFSFQSAGTPAPSGSLSESLQSAFHPARLVPTRQTSDQPGDTFDAELETGNFGLQMKYQWV